MTDAATNAAATAERAGAMQTSNAAQPPAKPETAKAPAGLSAAQIVADHPADPDANGNLAFLVLKSGPTFGPSGWFTDLTPAEALPHLKGDKPVLAIPTASQLQRRRR